MTAVALADILFDEGENVGGNTYELTFAPIHWIEALGEPVQGVARRFPDMLPGHSPQRMRITEDRRDWRETESLGAGGPVWQVEYSVFIPRIDVARKQRLIAIAQHPLIVEAQDNNGVLRRMGNLRNPADLEVTFATGQGSAATNGASLSFRWRHDAPAPVVDYNYQVDLSHLD